MSEDQTAPSTKLVIFGLDGATFDVIDPLIADGKLPNIQRLLEAGTRAQLRSTIHPITPQAWSTFITGKNAGKHGIFDFRTRVPGTYRFDVVSAGWRSGRSLWSYFGEAGLKVGVVNVPFTYPVEKVNGFMIPGFDAPRPDGENSYPSGIFEELAKAIGGYEFKGRFGGVEFRERNTPEYLGRIIKNRGDAARYLLRNKPWDLFMIVWNETDIMQHFFWRQMEELRAGSKDPEVMQYGKMIEIAYVEVDKAIGELLKELPKDAHVMLISDHGGGRLLKHVHLNRWLASEGLLKFRSSARGQKPLLVRILNRLKYHLKRRIDPQRLDDLKARYKKAIDAADAASIYGEIDWAATKAYSHGMYGNISLNVMGREPQGAVEGSDVERVTREVIEKLLALTDPDTGEKIVERVHRREELYSGPYVEHAPDLVIEWKDYAYFARASSEADRKDIFETLQFKGISTLEHSGTHRINGIFSLTGSSAATGKVLTGASIADVTPTILRLFGLPVPEDMDGIVLREAFTEEHNRRHTEATRAGDQQGYKEREDIYAPEEAEEIRSRLAELGYLE